MVVSCSAFGCTNKFKTASGTHFFKFPLKKTVLLQQWIVALNRTNFIPTKFSRLCSQHFKPNDYLHDYSHMESYRIQLKPTAVPSVFHNVSSQLQPTKVTAKHENQNKNKEEPHKEISQENPGLVEIDEITNNIIKEDSREEEKDIQMEQVEESQKDPCQENSAEFMNVVKPESILVAIPTTSRNSVSIQTDYVIATEEKRIHKIRMLQQKLRRRNLKIDKLRNLLREKGSKKSLRNPDGENQSFAYIYSWCENSGVSCRRVSIAEPKPRDGLVNPIYIGVP